MSKRDEKAYGPMDSDLAVHLIGKQILFARHEEGLGTYGTLENISFGMPAPYNVVTDRGTKIQARWIALWQK